MNSLYRKAIFLVASVFLLIYIGYTSQVGYAFVKKINQHFFANNTLIIDMADRLVFELDLIRLWKKISASDDDFIDIKLSSSDLDSLQKMKDRFIDQGFINDNDNQWRKGEILIDDDLVDIKFKLHGTSVTPLKKGGISLRLKHKKEGPYLNHARDFKLITAYDDADITTIILNGIAENLGLIAPKRKFITLRVNGNDLGLYQFEEHHSKEWFEKNFGLTNYTILKSVDDWDRKELDAHNSNSDLWVHNKEIKSSSATPEVALGALEILMQAIRKEDIATVKRLIDINYFAKFVALYSIINNNHPITGDNLKYIFNHTNRKFKVLFRVEDYIFPLDKSVEKFSHSWLHNPEDYSGSKTHNLFVLLMKDPDFISMKNKEINNIVNESNEINALARKIYEENYNPLSYNSNSIPRHRMQYDKNNFFRVLEGNIKIADQYINYEKVFFSVERNNDSQKLSILNDSYQDLLIKNISFNEDASRDNIGIVANLNEINIKINQSSLNDKFKQKIEPQEILIESTSDISNIDIQNLTTGKTVSQNNIYINYLSPLKLLTYEESIDTIIANGLKYIIDDKNNILVKAGDYQIKSNLIFPEGSGVVFESGIKLRIDKETSVLIQGSFIAKGKVNEPITISRLSENDPFGTFAVIGIHQPAKVDLSFLNLSGGSSGIVQGIQFLGQLSIHNADVSFFNVSSSESVSDDGVNIRDSIINISQSNFFNNQFDQVDLDFCDGIVKQSYFSSGKKIKSGELVNGDGLDLSGSNIVLDSNTFESLGDKGLSVGEASRVILDKNVFLRNLNAIAVKDESQAYVLIDNEFSDNTNNYNLYIKKPFFKAPKLFIDNFDELKTVKGDGLILQLEENPTPLNFFDYE